ncbi:hypothetical protein C0991_011375 [Blastosporella zonata]|nr:hypothetical protein C0991_011375 [Blastosporella zonata]
MGLLKYCIITLYNSPDGKLLIVTPIDPTFLLLPILLAVQPVDGSAGTFRQADVIFEEAAGKLQTPGKTDDASLSEKDIIGLGSIQCAKDALRNVCDVKEISPEIVVYRLSEAKVLEYLRSKVTRLSSPNALEVSKSIIRTLAKDGLMEDGKEDLLQVGRVRAACDLLGQYISPEYRALLIKSYDFKELDAFLQIALDEAATATAVDSKGGKKGKAKPAVVEDKKRKNAKGSQEKAVQTHRIEKLQSTSSNPAQNLQGHGPGDDSEETSSVYYSGNDGATADTAYTYPDSLSLSHNPPPSPPARLSVLHRTVKPAQLSYSRPNMPRSREKRVISLPEAPALKYSSGSLFVPVHDGPLQRVVSLPAPDLLSNPNLDSSTTSQENSSSLEYLDTSLETSYRSSRTGSVHHNPRSFPPSDMPATPSPPSSPESILVVSSDTRVSKTFLHQCDISSRKACDGEDEGGWITWASSPPRPIPALHGPLSLPYARCPSGAEGTIIEDADVPRMIWGLDLEDTQPNSVRPIKIHPQLGTLQAPIFSKEVTRSTAYAPPQPLEHADHGILARKEARQGSRNVLVGTGSKPLVLAPEPRPQETHEACTEKLQRWDDTPINIHALNYTSTTVGPAWSHPHRKTSELKASAPVFVPSVPRPYPFPAMTPRIFIEPRAGSQITPGHRLSAIEIAQRYHVERKQTTLPAVPFPELSSTWSPATISFGSPTASVGSIPFSPQPVRELVPQFNSKTSTPRREFPAEIHKIEAAQRELSNIISLSNADYSNSTPSFSPRRDPHAPVSSPQDSFIRPSSTIDMSLIFKRLASSKHHSTVDQDITLIDPLAHRPSLHPPKAQNFQGTRPQSIPMARLMQRRLSIVAEEDSSYTTGPSPHPPSIRPHIIDSFSGSHSGSGTKVAVTPPDSGRDTNRETARGNDNKENAIDSMKGIGAEKNTVRKKWRPRKKAGASSNVRLNGN